MYSDKEASETRSWKPLEVTTRLHIAVTLSILINTLKLFSTLIENFLSD